VFQAIAVLDIEQYGLVGGVAILAVVLMAVGTMLARRLLATARR
jgi:hypothetical protein